MPTWKHVGTQPIDIGGGFAYPGETFAADLPKERVAFYTTIGAIVEVAETKSEPEPRKRRLAPDEEVSHGD